MRPLKWKVIKFLRLERAVWNAEWALGRWDVLDAVDPISIELTQKYASKGRIIEFGCGSGALIEKVGALYYESYKGIDISYKAIERANSKHLPNCVFEIRRMQDWRGEPADLIIIREALYYLSATEQKNIIDVSLSSVGTHGAIYVSVHDVAQFGAILGLLRESGSVLEERRASAGSTEAAHIVIGAKAGGGG
jgi:2-polyprenyl-3-methyl-5-hydroxy-6-metoxy-1,4-benzoquinol methylase